MKPFRRKPKENAVVTHIRRELTTHGWLVVKLHGNMFQSGLPDLWCSHPEHGQRWIEVKRASDGELRPSQVRMFKKMTNHGTGVWVVCDPRTVERTIMNEPNWHHWASGSMARRLDIERQRR